jgi:Flp pilus assembly protein TadG
MHKNERGSAAVEFALVLPILVLLALALVQVGLLVRDQLILVEAARAGARQAAVTEDDAEIRAAIEAASYSLRAEEVDSEVSRSGSLGDPVTVSLDYPETARVPFVAWLFPNEITLRAGATMRQEFA